MVDWEARGVLQLRWLTAGTKIQILDLCGESLFNFHATQCVVLCFPRRWMLDGRRMVIHHNGTLHAKSRCTGVVRRVDYKGRVALSVVPTARPGSSEASDDGVVKGKGMQFPRPPSSPTSIYASMRGSLSFRRRRPRHALA